MGLKTMAADCKSGMVSTSCPLRSHSVASLQLRAQPKNKAPSPFRSVLTAAQQEVTHAKMMTCHAHREGGHIAPLSFGDFTNKPVGVGH